MKTPTCVMMALLVIMGDSLNSILYKLGKRLPSCNNMTNQLYKGMQLFSIAILFVYFDLTLF